MKKTIKNLKLLIVLDRDVSIGMGGIVYSEIAAHLYPLESKPALINYIVGLGGRFVTVHDLKTLTIDAITETKAGKIDPPIRWVGVRGLS